MNSNTTNLVTLLWVAFALICGIHGSHDARYNYFDDYLSSLDEEHEENVTASNQEVERSGVDPSPNLNIPKYHKLPLRTGLTRSKDVTCCSLGYLAGDKGYHCVAKFYYARILLRNQNRAHNRKLGFYGHDSVSNYGKKLMMTFEQCVSRRGKLFHKCCQIAANNGRDRPHFDNRQRKRYELKMSKIRIPITVPVEHTLFEQ